MARATGNNPLWFPCNMGMHQEFGKSGAPPGTIYSCTNSRLDADGVLVLRGGHVALDADTNIPTGILIAGNGTTNHTHKPSFLTRIGDAACVGSSMGAMFSRDTTNSATTWHAQGYFSTCQPVRKRNGLMGAVLGSSFGFGETPAAQAVNSAGYLLYAAASDNSLAHVTIENAEGTRIYYTTITSKTKIQALAIGTTFYVITQEGTDISAQSLTPDGTDVNEGTETTVGTLTSSSAHWDTSTYDTASWLLVHQSAAGTMRIDMMTGTSSVDNTTFAVTGTCPVSIWGQNETGTSNDRVWVGYYNDPTVTGDVRYRVYDRALDVVLGETTITSAPDVYGPPLFSKYRDLSPGGGSTTTTAFLVFRYVEVLGNETRGMRYGTATTTGTVSASSTLWHVLPISKPDNYNRVWVMTSNGSDNFELQRALLVRFTNSWIIELASPNMAGTLRAYDPEFSAMYFHAQATGTTSSFFGFPFVLNVMSNDEPLAKIEIYEFQTAEQYQWLDTERVGNSTIVAGQPVVAQGRSYSQYASGAILRQGAAEIGFVQAPVITSATSNNSSDGAGEFSYRVMYEWADAYGNRHRSPPSTPVEVSARGSNVSVELFFTSCELSQRVDSNLESAPQYLVFRTTNGGTTYFRLPFSALASDSSDGVLQITDTFEDSQIEGNEILYTDGGVLPDTLAPSCRFLADSEERVWFAGLWDPRLIQCTKVMVPSEALACTDDASHQVFLPGDCTGLAYMDGALIAFTADEIYVVSGAGPNDQGVGQFAPPRKMAQGIGCIDGRSVLETNIGVMFQSARGIELLPLGLGPVVWIGKAVKDVFQVDGLTEVVAAGVRTGTKGTTAHFLVKVPANASTQTVLVYDIDRGEWFRDALNFACSTHGMWPDGPAYAAADFSSSTYPNPFLYEDGTQDGDGPVGSTAFVSRTVTFCALYPFGSPVAWGSVNKIQIVTEATDTSASNPYEITMSATTDASATQSTSSAWSILPTSGNRYWRQWDLPSDRRCSSVVISFTETQDTSVGGDGLKFIGIGFEVHTDGGIHLTNPANDERR